MGINDELAKLKFDKRLVEWNLRNKVIKRDEFDKHIASLEDSQANAIAVDLEAEDTDDTGFDYN